MSRARGGGSLIFPKVPQSSQTESLGFPRNTPPLPLNRAGPLSQARIFFPITKLVSTCQENPALEAAKDGRPPEGEVFALGFRFF